MDLSFATVADRHALRAGDTKTIDGFPHYVANGGVQNEGQWHTE